MDYSPLEAPASAGDGRVPWTLGDLAKALAFPALLFALSLLAVVTGTDDSSAEDYTQGELIVLFGFGVAFELFMLFMAWWFTARKYRVNWGDLGLRLPRRGSLWLGGAIFLGALAITIVYSLALELAGADVDAELPDNVFSDVAPAALLVLTAVLLAPFVEEVFFRGFVFGGLRSAWGPLAGAISSGIVFGLMHMGNPGSYYIVPPIAAIGILFAWGFLYTGSILPGMIAHFLFNLLSVSQVALS